VLVRKTQWSIIRVTTTALEHAGRRSVPDLRGRNGGAEMNARFVTMDARALDHVREELEATNRLGRLVASTLDLDEGRVFGFIPESHVPDTYNFRRGIFQRVGRPRTPVAGGYVEEVPSTEAEVAVWVHTALASDRRRALVCESYLLRAKDLTRASQLPRRTVAGGDYVYHWATHGDAPEEVRAVVRMAYPVPVGFAVISALPVSPAQMLGCSELDRRILSAIAAAIECVLVGAYDGESVLIWLRKATFLSIPED
jgi:hypothetical protein